MASSNHVQCSIELAEPVLFQNGFDLGCQSSADEEQEAILRGKLVLRITHASKLKAVRLDFSGKSKQEDTQGSRPQTQNQLEEREFLKHTWVFFDVHRAFDPNNGNREGLEDSRASVRLRIPSAYAEYTALQAPSTWSDVDSSNSDFGHSEQQIVQQECQHFKSKYFRKRTGSKHADHHLFEPGVYEYFFEFPIPQKCPESLVVGRRYVQYQLEASVELKGMFAFNIQVTKQVILVRVPHLDSVDQAWPIVIDKTWKDELHYNLAIPSKSFPIGATIPIALRLASSKIRCHSIKVYLTENIQYFGHGENSYRRAPNRKIKLLEESVESRYLGDLKVVRSVAPVEEPTKSTKGLGTSTKDDSEKTNVDTTLGDAQETRFGHGSTKIKLQVQLPSCRIMCGSGPSQRVHFDTNWDGVNINHWINVVLNLHKSEPQSPAETQRRCFEISIDSPIQILSCYATPSNTFLPAYSKINDTTIAQRFECGCPDAVTQCDLRPLETPANASDVVNTSSTRQAVSKHTRVKLSAMLLQPDNLRSLESDVYSFVSGRPHSLVLPPEYDDGVGGPSSNSLNIYSTRRPPPDYSYEGHN